MNVRAPLRRADFDAIADGWGGDDLDDLLARCDLLMEFWTAPGNFPLLPAELKITQAIVKRLGELGGVPPIAFN